MPHEHGLSSLPIELLQAFPGKVRVPATGEGTTGHGCGSVCHCASASKPPGTPASRMRGLGARDQNSHHFGRDTGATVDILLKIQAGVLIFIF